MGPRVGLDRRKSRPHRDSIPDCTARSSVAIPTELPGPLYIYIYIYIYKRARSRNHFCRGKGISNAYSDCVCDEAEVHQGMQ